MLLSESIGETRRPIAFFLDNSGIKDVPLSDISLGNPGIGGTEFAYFLLADLLRAKHELIIYSPYSPKGIDRTIRWRCCQTQDEAVSHFDACGGGHYLITSYFAPQVLETARTEHTVFVIWFHIDIGYSGLRKIEESQLPFLCAFLTPDQRIKYSLYRRIMLSSLIVKAPIVHGVEKPRSLPLRPNVTWLGSLMPFKHFEILADAWPLVVKKIPGAHLYVPGGGNLYNRDSRLGEFGIADTVYEQRILKPLIEAGVMDTVSFLGVVSSSLITEKLLPQTAVGVVNLGYSGYGETFCLSALQFAQASIPVVGGDLDALKYTLPFGCGHRIKSTKQAANAIVDLLSHQQKNLRYGKRYRRFQAKTYRLTEYRDNWERLLSPSFVSDINFIKLLWYKIRFRVRDARHRGNRIVFTVFQRIAKRRIKQ